MISCLWCCHGLKDELYFILTFAGWLVIIVLALSLFPFVSEIILGLVTDCSYAYSQCRCSWGASVIVCWSAGCWWSPSLWESNIPCESFLTDCCMRRCGHGIPVQTVLRHPVGDYNYNILETSTTGVKFGTNIIGHWVTSLTNVPASLLMAIGEWHTCR